ncbi:MAG: transglutaminase domain-containing protein, partial [Clostridiales bacterium]|nr:transglutaminase domain-containing protein [Clostridiales bacterium]
GAVEQLSGETVLRSAGSLLDTVELAAALLLSVYITNRVFFVQYGSVFNKIYDKIPENIKLMVFQQDVLTYLLSVPLLLILMLLILRLFTTIFYRRVLVPFAENVQVGLIHRSKDFRRFLGGLWQLPKGLVFTVFFVFIMNFSSYYIYSPNLSRWTSESASYQLICRDILYPVLNSNMAKEVPVLLNDSFRQAIGVLIPQEVNTATTTAADTIEKLTGGNVKVIEYFNGMTLDDAVKSNSHIDQAAVRIVGNETDDVKKAKLIYSWISKNIKYDYEKARAIVSDPTGIVSGSIPAYETRTGICFDYSCLFVSMCRATGLKVRIVTGIAYGGSSWGDHAWNQVYDSGDAVWINVDTTFGASGVSYFGKKDFFADHREAEVQGEW